MRAGRRIGVVMPALDEEQGVARALGAVPGWVDRIVVVDNGSRDATASVASAAGAEVVHEPRKGYGSACQRGIAALDDVDVLVFLDADNSDHPEHMGRLVDPVARGDYTLVLGERRGAGLPLHQRAGTRLVISLVNWRWGTRYRDLGPFRVIERRALETLDMCDRDFGWTVEMQIKAKLAGLRTLELPVPCRPRIGVSKISGTFKGSVCAGLKMLSVVAGLGLWLQGRRSPPPAGRGGGD